jgi:hypothetical protein
MPFSKLGLTPSLCTPLANMGSTQPTPVQSASIPIIMTGADLLARAQTGTRDSRWLRARSVQPREPRKKSPRRGFVPGSPRHHSVRNAGGLSSADLSAHRAGIAAPQCRQADDVATDLETRHATSAFPYHRRAQAY